MTAATGGYEESWTLVKIRRPTRLRGRRKLGMPFPLLEEKTSKPVKQYISMDGLFVDEVNEERAQEAEEFVSSMSQLTGLGMR